MPTSTGVGSVNTAPFCASYLQLDYFPTMCSTHLWRKDVTPLEVEEDGIAELWFKNKAAFD